MALHIVLHEPEIPQNTGNIARTCAAAGAKLHLIEPLGFSLADKYLRRAGMDYWKQLSPSLHADWESFTRETEAVPGVNTFFFTTKAPQVYADVNFPEESYLVFGRESHGIPEELLSRHRKSCIRIPMAQQYRSLNLSSAAAVAVYEYLRQHQFPSLSLTGTLHRLKWQDGES
jgi:tRNA (cytidine/uridine-2'-O-)-methyltransferase